ncbi:MAG: hypothetical protein RJA70_1130 [Pseudomonadota bacterium]|jgi:peptide methionine sulfoxide reductase msrA/msrB
MSKLCIISLSCVIAATGCTKPQQDAPPVASQAVSNLGTPTQARAQALAYFAGGCFWGVEHYLEQLEGVLSVESGYMGGHVESPSYEDVVAKETGHLETVRVRYEPSKVSYEQVAKRFFEIHDPTQADGQGPDLGPQYHSAIFFSGPEERTVTESLISQLKARGFQVVTELRPAGTFWPAEQYHQDYYNRTGKKPYCHTRVRRFDEPLVP